jgi:hypothetical protein
MSPLHGDVEYTTLTALYANVRVSAPVPASGDVTL